MSGHKHLKAHKKHFFLITLVAILIVLALMFFTDTKLGDLSELSSGTATQPMKIRATLDSLPELEFERRFETIEFTLASDENNIVRIGEGVLDVEGGQPAVTLQEFTGKVYLAGDALTLDGKVNKVLANGVGIKKDSFSIKVLAENVKFETLTLPELEIGYMPYQATGTLEIEDGKGTFNLADDTIAMEDFYGTIDIDEDVVLSGTVSRISVSDITVRK